MAFENITWEVTGTEVPLEPRSQGDRKLVPAAPCHVCEGRIFKAWLLQHLRDMVK